MEQASHTYGIVHPLINRGSHPTSLFAHDNHFSHFESGEVAQSQLHKFAFFMHIIDDLQRLFKRHRSIRRMKIEDVDTVCLELLQGRLQGFSNLLFLVHTRLGWIALGRQLQPTLFPMGPRRPCFLRSVDIYPGGIDFIVPLGLEVI